LDCIEGFRTGFEGVVELEVLVFDPIGGLVLAAGAAPSLRAPMPAVNDALSGFRPIWTLVNRSAISSIASSDHPSGVPATAFAFPFHFPPLLLVAEDEELGTTCLFAMLEVADEEGSPKVD
jgi:hypothetical protein